MDRLECDFQGEESRLALEYPPAALRRHISFPIRFVMIAMIITALQLAGIQLTPGIYYFSGLRYPKSGLWSLLEVEDNARRAARKS